MRIPCPFCGERDLHEFSYLGDATVTRSDPAAPEAERAFFESVYLRDNPAGRLLEMWVHDPCGAWIVVDRDTVTHAVHATTLAREAPR